MPCFRNLGLPYKAITRENWRAENERRVRLGITPLAVDGAEAPTGELVPGR